MEHSLKSVSLVYVTTANIEEAKRIGEALVTERLAAAVNIVGDVRSMYRWNNEVHEKNEILLIAKTSTTQVGKAIERIRSLHSYQCPCVVSWPIARANESYLNWIREQTE
jgi:periplasmic divalent cation tolerance protein